MHLIVIEKSQQNKKLLLRNRLGILRFMVSSCIMLQLSLRCISENSVRVSCICQYDWWNCIRRRATAKDRRRRRITGETSDICRRLTCQNNRQSTFAGIHVSCHRLCTIITIIVIISNSSSCCCCCASLWKRSYPSSKARYTLATKLNSTRSTLLKVDLVALAPYTLATKSTVSATKLNVSATKSTATSC